MTQVASYVIPWVYDKFQKEVNFCQSELSSDSKNQSTLDSETSSE